jgi:transaldolase
MKATQLLDNLGQSVWLDNITRDLLDSGKLKRYINELSVTDSPRIPRSSIMPSKIHNSPIRRKSDGKSGEAFFLSWHWKT